MRGSVRRGGCGGDDERARVNDRGQSAYEPRGRGPHKCLPSHGESKDEPSHQARWEGEPPPAPVG